MVSLYRDPDGEGIFYQQPSVTNAVNTAVHVTLNQPEEIEELRRKVTVMEKTIRKLKVLLNIFNNN